MKRASDRQLTKDDSDRGAQDVPSDQPGEFEKAAPDVLAKRRILKVRRSVPKQTAPAAPAAPAEPKPANPFAALKGEAQPETKQVKETPKEDANAVAEEKEDIAPPVDPAPEREAQKQDGEEKAEEGDKSHEAKAPDAVPENPADSPAAEAPPKKDDEQPPAAASETPDVPAPPEEASKPDAAEEPEQPSAKPDAAEKPDEPASAKADAAPTTATPAKPDEAPVAEPAAKEDAAPHAEPAKPEAAAATEAPAKTEVPPAAEPVKGVDAAALTPAAKTNGATFKAPISFGGVSSSVPLTFANAAAADNGTFNIKLATAAAPAAAPAKEFKEAQVETGEENERELFRAPRAKLYNLETGESGTARWKERGVGGLKLNLHVENKKARLLMRTEATLKVILNTPIFEGFKFDRATERSLRFQGYDPEDAKKPLTFLVRFTTRDISNGLVEAVEKVQDGEGDK